MKNKKKLFIGTLPVLLLGLAGASLGTVAWFEATRNIVAGDSEKSLDVEASAVELGDIKIYLEAPSSALPAVELTDAQGNRWAVIKGADNKYYYQSVPLTSFEGTYGTIPLSARAVKLEGSTETPVSANELKPYVGQELTFNVYGNDRTRVSFTAPSATDKTVYSNATGDSNKLSITLKIDSISGDAVIYKYNTQSNLNVYYSVAGGTTKNTDIHDGDECTDPVDSVTTGVGKIFIRQKALIDTLYFDIDGDMYYEPFVFTAKWTCSASANPDLNFEWSFVVDDGYGVIDDYYKVTVQNEKCILKNINWPSWEHLIVVNLVELNSGKSHTYDFLCGGIN